MLYLWMPEGQGQWLWQIDQGEWQQADSIDQLLQNVALLYQGKEAIVFFPSQSAQFYTQSLTRAQYKQLGTQGVQYLLEEYSIEPLDQLAIFHDYHQDQLNMMAISRQQREMYQQSLTLLPWQIQALLPDFLTVPEPDAETVNIAQVFRHKVMRWSKFRGLRLDDVSVVGLLAPEIKTVNFYHLEQKLEDLIRIQLGEEIEYQQKTLQQLTLAKAKQHPFNALLKSRKQQRTGFNYWKACAALLCIALVSQVTYDTLRWWKYKQLSNQTAQLAVDQYQQWFPNETRVNEQNLRSQFSSKLRLNASADTQALQLISRVGPILQQANIQAQQVQYQNQALNLSLLAANSQVLNQLTEQFKQQGFNVELGAIRNQDSQVIGLIKVQ